MAATYRALCEHGYADLTMQDIADETDKSKAALHYHYDSKRELLLAFLDFLYERFTDRVGDPAGDDAEERLRTVLDRVLSPPVEGDERVAFRTALLELTAQAPYDEEFRERLAEFDAFLREEIEQIVAAGIDEGVFRADAEPADTARFLVTVLDGARTKQVAVGRDVDCTRRMVNQYVDRQLLVADRTSTAVSKGAPE